MVRINVPDSLTFHRALKRRMLCNNIEMLVRGHQLQIVFQALHGDHQICQRNGESFSTEESLISFSRSDSGIIVQKPSLLFIIMEDIFMPDLSNANIYILDFVPAFTFFYNYFCSGIAFFTQTDYNDINTCDGHGAFA
jgi:hypothetical protein